MKNWQKVFETQILHRAEIVKSVLSEAMIDGIIVNKKDSMYNLGYFEVHVARESVLNAIKLINENIKFE
ncbi:MAG: hypothetical protein ACFCUU_17105 [Cyclobacteriaceae bacterium]